MMRQEASGLKLTSPVRRPTSNFPEKSLYFWLLMVLMGAVYTALVQCCMTWKNTMNSYTNLKIIQIFQISEKRIQLFQLKTITTLYQYNGKWPSIWKIQVILLLPKRMHILQQQSSQLKYEQQQKQNPHFPDNR